MYFSKNYSPPAQVKKSGDVPIRPLGKAPRNNISNAGPKSEEHGQTNSSIYRLPCLIAGLRCYVNASTTPDDPSKVSRAAGLGIFLLDPVVGLKCYIKALVKQINSVLMAESAGLDLASRICSKLGANEVSFLTDK